MIFYDSPGLSALPGVLLLFSLVGIGGRGEEEEEMELLGRFMGDVSWGKRTVEFIMMGILLGSFSAGQGRGVHDYLGGVLPHAAKIDGVYLFCKR